MENLAINEVLAKNLKTAMSAKGLTQAALAKKCGVAQTTISLYLSPDRRKLGASGKIPSAKLSEAEMLASAVGLKVWELLRHGSSWPFEQIEQERFESLKDFQKIEIQGSVRSLIQQFEIQNSPKVSQMSGPKAVRHREPKHNNQGK